MTAEPAGVVGLGPLGRRLLAAFALVVVVTVALVSCAAFIGTGRGLDRASAEERDLVVARVVETLAGAYAQAGGWEDADLGPAEAVAAAAGARLVVVDPGGTTVRGRRGPAGTQGNGGGSAGGNGAGGPGGAGAGGETAGSSGSAASSGPVVVDGTVVGTARVVFGSPSTTARDIAWWWIALATVLALAIALAAAWWVSRRLSRPLARVAATARAFAGGDRSARTGGAGPGEIGDVAQAVDDMADDVVRSEDGRRRMASDVAHELRTPLSVLQAGLEEVRDGLAEPTGELLARLHDQSLRLGRIVDDLAALSAAESGALRLSLRSLDLAELVASEVSAHEPRLRAAELVLRVEAQPPVPVRGDPDRLRQVVANLLSNAARYCRAGDGVDVRVTCEAGRAVLTVADGGPGIPADELPHVFDRLWRGGAGVRVGGSGIGLAVVRELVSAHGGTVQALSDGSTGTTFRVELPLADRRSP